MINRRFILEALTLIVSAILCATAANAFAARDKKLKLVQGTVSVQRPGVNETRGRGGEGERGRETVSPPQSLPISPSRTRPIPPSPTRPLAPSPTRQAAQPAKPREFPPHPDKPWVEIDSASVRELYARGVPFIDARRTGVYEEGHIAGARSIPVWEADLDERLKALYEENLDPEAPIVIYCSGGNCEDSHMLGQRLWGLSFNNVLVYKDGYPDWVKNGGPTRTGPSR